MKMMNLPEDEDIIKSFSKIIDLSDFPDFFNLDTKLKKGLWVLWVAKEKLNIKMMSSKQITLVIKEIKEINVKEKSITYSFNAASSDFIYKYRKNDQVYYEIMKPGKDYLISQSGNKLIELYYFQPGKHFTSKRILYNKILINLKGEIKIVDPYCDEKTLDILSDVKNKVIKFLTKIDYLTANKKSRFLRNYQDFKIEHPKIEFRDYPNNDIHDRYILSKDLLIILGHSIKNLGEKESFAIVLYKNNNINISDSLSESFNRRWKHSAIL